MTNTNTDTAAMRRALIKAGKPTRGLSEDEITAAYNALTGQLTAGMAAHAGITLPDPLKHSPATPAAAPPPAATPAAAPPPAATPPTRGALEDTIIALIHEHAPQLTAAPVTTLRIEQYDRAEPVTITGAHPALPEVLDVLSIAHLTNQWPYLCGPAGSGKTTLAAQAAEALGVPLYSTPAVLDAFALVGFVDANGRHHETDLYRAMSGGGVFLYDEIDASAAEATIVFNQMLANGVYTFPNGETLDQPKNCYFIAAANTIGTGATRQYNARNALDGATLDRFHLIFVNYDDATELAMATAAVAAIDPDKSTGYIAAVQSKVQRIRETLAEAQSDAIVSPRATRQIAALIALGWKESRAFESVVHNRLTTDQAARVAAIQE